MSGIFAILSFCIFSISVEKEHSNRHQFVLCGFPDERFMIVFGAPEDVLRERPYILFVDKYGNLQDLLGHHVTLEMVKKGLASDKEPMHFKLLLMLERDHRTAIMTVLKFLLEFQLSARPMKHIVVYLH